ncbi:hypothetical protein CSKR_113181 [Clonorchis sinensis]|uniref:Uncharacterized protein n=1 Tax=Clonorchis sinensis TaxID=79923 RepID=A0A3R7G8X0_CLOSI|nr:hypothetical protein CSKR_113181 [Clonorchis sinensis]
MQRIPLALGPSQPQAQGASNLAPMMRLSTHGQSMQRLSIPLQPHGPSSIVQSLQPLPMPPAPSQPQPQGGDNTCESDEPFPIISSSSHLSS